MSGSKGRVAIITGAGQGIGRAYARAYAKAGIIPVIVDVESDNIMAVQNEINQENDIQCLAIEADITNPNQILAVTEKTIKKHGRIDILVNNAALFSSLTASPALDITLEEWKRVMDVNITGQFICAQAVLPHMIKNNWGRIINISSGTVTMGLTNLLHYVTSKAAVIGFTRSLAREVGEHGITVNVILPGSTQTEIERTTTTPELRRKIVDMQCIKRVETPDDLANFALFLASGESGFITGQSIAVDGGLTHL
ncbi:MAG: glucose 1-dehydrogenase [Pseudomonadota bacterium]|nr:glucose 1-dehydrogenase [Pseudomonadota bacterium]